MSEPRRHFVRHYLLAVQFFTRLPVTGALAQWVGFSPELLRASTAHFPGVGLLLGLLLAALASALIWAMPYTHYAPLVVACLITAAGIWLTGALHEDGLADVADGLGGSAERARALEIMKDSRVGAYGVIAVAMALLLKVALLAMLASLGVAVLMTGLVLGAVFSRNYALWVIRALPNVGQAETSKSRAMAEQISLGSLLVGGVWCLLALLLVLEVHELWGQWAAGTGAAWGLMPLRQWAAAVVTAVLASLLVWWWLVRWYGQRLQGFTGDCLGATQVLCELAFYFGLVLGWGLEA